MKRVILAALAVTAVMGMAHYSLMLKPAMVTP